MSPSSEHLLCARCWPVQYMCISSFHLLTTERLQGCHWYPQCADAGTWAAKALCLTACLPCATLNWCPGHLGEMVNLPSHPHAPGRPLPAAGTLTSHGHALFFPPLVPQIGRRVAFQERGGRQLVCDLVSGTRGMCPVPSQIIFKPKLPPHLEWLLIFNTEVCVFTICSSKQSQSASPRHHLLCNRKDTKCLCLLGALENV